MNGNYESIIDLPRHISERYHPMSAYKRAAQFAPFAALEGYKEIIEESNRYVETEIELADDQKAELDYKLQYIIHNIENEPFASFTYYTKDIIKNGGEYTTVKGNVKLIDLMNNKICLTDSTIIPSRNVIQIEIDYDE